MSENSTPLGPPEDTPADPASQIAEIREAIGLRAAEWLLGGCDGAALAEHGRAALAMLHALVCPVDQPAGFEAVTAKTRLLHYLDDVEMTVGNYFRATFGQAIPVAVRENDDDDLTYALARLAVDAFPALLVHCGEFPSAPIFLRHPIHGEFVDALRNDEVLGPLAGTGDPMTGAGVARSTGVMSGIQLISLSGLLIQAAWELAELPTGAADLSDLLQSIPTIVATARDALDGRQSATCVGLTGLTGVLLPEGRVVPFPGGRLRRCRPSERPTHLDRTTIQSRATGDDISINDGGDLVLEVSVPFTAEVTSDAFDGFNHRHSSSLYSLADAVSLARIAFLLSSRSLGYPPLLGVWQRFIDPFYSWGYSFSDPQHAAFRTPTLLTEEQANSWAEWLQILTQEDLKQVGSLATKRLLRAAAERQDALDSLIDSVIALEALLGGGSEATLRVSAGVAKLCYPAGEARESARAEVHKLYNMRSKLVHGVKEPTPEEIVDAGRRCLDYAVQAVSMLVTDRRDLLPLKSSERSLALLLE